MQYKIEKGIPFGEAEKATYPFAKMAVGDSFKCPVSERGKVTGGASHYAKRNGGKFQSKTFGKEIRVWRVA